jgi:hypothetical protein
VRSRTSEVGDIRSGEAAHFCTCRLVARRSSTARVDVVKDEARDTPPVGFLRYDVRALRDIGRRPRRVTALGILQTSNHLLSGQSRAVVAEPCQPSGAASSHRAEAPAQGARHFRRAGLAEALAIAVSCGDRFRDCGGPILIAPDDASKTALTRAWAALGNAGGIGVCNRSSAIPR